jgi:hypothetical protein
LSDPNAGVILVLRRTEPWVRLLSIVGFLTVAVVTLLGVASWVGISTERVDTIPFAALVVYPVLIVVYLLPSLYLHKYARRIRVFVAQGHMVQLEGALKAEQAFWRFLGIIALVCTGLAVMTLLAALAIGIMASM